MAQEKAKRAELRLDHAVVASFGPVLASMPREKDGEWSIRGYCHELDKFLAKHGDPAEMNVRFLLGTSWWEIPQVLNVELKEDKGKTFIIVKAKGEETIREQAA